MADAASQLNEIAGALDALAAKIVESIPYEQSLMEAISWTCPAINRYEISEYVRSPISKIHTMNTKDISDSDFRTISQIPGRIVYYTSNVIQHFANGNAFHAHATLQGLIDSLTAVVDRYQPPALDLERLEDKSMVPAAQFRRLQTLARNVDRIGAESATLSGKIAEINAAHSAAEALPTTLAELADAQNDFKKALGQLDADVKRIDASKETAAVDLVAIRGLKDEATQLMVNIEAAYSAATTQGLGKAFADKANSLKTNTWSLFGALAVTLGVGGYITWTRVEWLHRMMEKPNASVDMVWANVALTLASVAGPIWFAWLLTKQIGQRFRLAEDYEYKASVAKAYEGYRREAVQTDPEQGKRLFALALDRLSEEPLRHVERPQHGSPLSEIASTILNRRNKTVDKNEEG